MEGEREGDDPGVEAACRLGLPTLLVRGGQSDVVNEESARGFLSLCPGAEFVNIAGAIHMVSGDRNDVFGRAGLSFLRRAVPVAGEEGVSRKLADGTDAAPKTQEA